MPERSGQLPINFDCLRGASRSSRLSDALSALPQCKLCRFIVDTVYAWRDDISNHRIGT